MANTYINLVHSEDSQSYDIKFYIKDENDKWVDFSDTSQTLGKDAFDKVSGNIKNKIEEVSGRLLTTVQSVVLKNQDGFFDRPFPSTLKTTDGSTASFPLSIGYKRTILKGRECKITIRMRASGALLHTTADTNNAAAIDPIEEHSLGHFLIEDVVPKLNKDQIVFSLVSLDHILQEKDASSIKNGYSWYQNRPVSFLIEEIIRGEFIKDGTIPTSYDIQQTPLMATINGDNAISVLGRPPLWDGENWHDQDGLYTRALCIANVNSTGNVLYLGCDDELWSYNMTTGVYTEIDDTTIIGDDASLLIKKIVYDSVNDDLVVFAWDDEYWGTKATAQARTGWPVRIYTWSGSGSLTEVTAGSGVERLTSLQYILRGTYKANHATYGDTYWIGYDVQYNVGAYGENIFIPFEQHIQNIDSNDYNNYRVKQADRTILGDLNPFETLDPFSQSSQLFTYQERSMAAWASHGVNSPGGCPLIYYVGQEPCVMLSSLNISSVMYVYYFRMTTASSLNRPSRDDSFSANSPWFELIQYSIDGNQTTYTHALPSSTCSTLSNSSPNCMKVNGSSGYAYLSGTRFPRDNNAAVAWGCSMNLGVTSSPFSTVIDLVSGESGDNLYWSLINFEFFDNNDGTASGAGEDKMVMVLFNRKTGMYLLAHGRRMAFNLTIMYTNCAKLKTSNFPFTGLAIDSVDHKIIVYGSGNIYSISKAGACEILQNVPAIPGEQGLLSNIVVNNSHSANKPDIFGVTSPTTHLESFYVYPEGNFMLFRFCQSLSNIVVLADFEDLSKLEAISKLAGSRDSLAFFNRDGDYIFTPQIYSSGTADFVIGDPTDIPSKYSQLALDFGYKRVYNVAKANSYTALYESPDPKALELIDRTDKNTESKSLKEIPFVDFSIIQKNTDSKLVRCYCIVGGKTDNGESRWKYTTFDNEIEVALASDASSSETTLTLYSVFGGDDITDGVHTSDYISIMNPDTGAVLYRIITAVNESLNQITIASSFGVAFDTGVTLTINRDFSKLDTSNNYTRWSDEGVTYLTSGESAAATDVTVHSTKNLSVGTVVTFGEVPYEYRITAIDSNTQFTFERATGTASGGLNVAVLTNDIVAAYYSPEDADGTEIGGTKLFIKWSAGTGSEEVGYTKTFIPGDRLIIDCPGVALKTETAGLQVVVDGTSISKLNSRKELSIDNRFMSRDLAKEIARRVVFYRSNPKYVLSVTLPIIPYVDIVTRNVDTYELTQIDVIDTNLFPYSQDCTESFTINEIIHDTNRGTTKFVLTGITAY